MKQELKPQSGTSEILECGHVESPHSDFTRGYGTDAQARRHCYACCAEADKKQMRDTGRITLYLTIEPDAVIYGDCKVTNWPGSLSFTGRFHKGSHNIARTRYDCWFRFEGSEWHGVQYGENTQLVHCRRCKGKAIK